MWGSDIGPHHDGLKEDEFKHRLDLDLDYTLGTSLGHLVEIDAVEEVRPDGPDFYAISERLDEIILGRVDEVAATDVEALIKHMHDDDPPESEDQSAVADGARVTIRSALADEFDVLPTGVEQFLRSGDQVDKLNTAIERISDTEDIEPRDDYGKITFRRGAIRYRLTADHVSRYDREVDN
jgi:hypothetical protein